MDTVSIVPLHVSHKICLKDIFLISDLHKNMLCRNNIVRHSQCHLIHNVDVRFPIFLRIKLEPIFYHQNNIEGMWCLVAGESTFSQLGAHWEAVVFSIPQTELRMSLNMSRLIFILLLASTLGADLTGLLEKLSQRERGNYWVDVQLSLYFYVC